MFYPGIKFYDIMCHSNKNEDSCLSLSLRFFSFFFLLIFFSSFSFSLIFLLSYCLFFYLHFFSSNLNFLSLFSSLDLLPFLPFLPFHLLLSLFRISNLHYTLSFLHPLFSFNFFILSTSIHVLFFLFFFSPAIF